MIKIAPSILSADFGHLVSDLKRVEKAGADLLHLDIMDGHFVSNLTFGPVVIKSFLGKTRLPLDIHLMVNNPERFIPLFSPLQPLYITFHWEADEERAKTVTEGRAETVAQERANINDLISQIKSRGIKVGLTLNPATPLDGLLKYLDKIDLALIMTVNPGFAGQKFMPEVLPKIKELRKIIETKKLEVDIEVDGGIDVENVQRVKEAGANIIVAGSSVFGAKDLKAIMATLKE